jgi:thioredoxin-dependent peroxiredoxin
MKKLYPFICFLISFNVLANTNQWEGVPLNAFKLLDQSGTTRTNEEFLGKWMVLYFYPKDKTPSCTVEAQNFTRDYPHYQKLNTQIVGVSYDDVASHQDFAETYEIPFVLLADTESQLSKAMKVDRILPWPHASRQTFLINPQGVIVHHFPDVTPSEHSAELLALLAQKQTQTLPKQEAQ